MKACRGRLGLRPGPSLQATLPPTVTGLTFPTALQRGYWFLVQTGKLRPQEKGHTLAAFPTGPWGRLGSPRHGGWAPEAAERGWPRGWQRARRSVGLKGIRFQIQAAVGTQRQWRPLLLPLLPASGQQTRMPSGAPPPAPDPLSLGHAFRPEPRFPRVRVLGAWRAPRRCAKEGEALPVGTGTHRECGSCYHSPFSRRRWGAAPGLQGITA